MKVFRIYFKILNKNRKSILIPILICLGIAALYNAGNQNSAEGFTFSETKTKVAFVNEDKDSPFSEGLKQYLSNYATFVTVGDDNDKKDALFFHNVEYIVILPSGYYQNLTSGKEPEVSKMVANQTFASVNIDSRINDYINTWEAYQKNLSNLTGEELVQKTSDALSLQTEVQMQGENDQSTLKENFVLFFNHSEYATLGALIAGMSIVLNVINKKELRMRTQCSPMKEKRKNLQLLLANSLFAFVIFLLNIGIANVLYKDLLFTKLGLWLSINLLIFTMTTMSLGLLVAQLSSSRQVQSAMNNIIALGMCFLSGSFVPQELLSKAVNNFAKFTPGYWFIKANDALSSMSNFALMNMKEIYICFAIDLGFAIAITAVSLLLAKQKSLAIK